jgi:Synergist-CTERM protein sorting domain-containing protein
VSLFALLFALGTAPAQDLIDPGTTLDDAAALQVSDDGLNSLGDALGVLIPSPVAVDPINQNGGAACLGYDITITNMLVDVEVTGARLVPKNSNSNERADIDLELDLLVAINDSTNKFDFDYEFDFCFTSPGGSCPGYILPFPVTVTGPVSILVVDDGTGSGETALDVEIGTLNVDNGLTGPHIELDCGIDTIEDLLNRVGLSFFDLIIQAVDPVLQGLVQDQVADLEQQIGDALSAASVDEHIDLQGIDLHVRLYPGSATSTTDGMQIGMAGFMQASPESDCVPLDPSGSLFTDNEGIPPLSALGATHAALQLSDDVANQALFGIWKGGLLCFEVGDGVESSIELPVPVNGSLLGLLGGEAFSELIAEDAPLLIKTDPRRPPEVNYDGAHDVVIEVRDLDINFYSELDYRMARPLGITLTADAGVNVLFDGTTGVASVDLALGPEEIRPEATMIEVAPHAKEDVEESFNGLLETLLDAFLGDALSGLSFGLPSLDGFGLTDLALGGSAGGEWLTGEAELGTVSYTSAGCDEGCSGGSGSGCSTGGTVPWVFALVLPLLRRRRD